MDEYKKTHELMSMIRKAFPESTHLYTFNANTSGTNREQAWQEMARETGFNVITGVGDYVEKMRGKTETKAKDGGHWNNSGHRFAAELIFAGLEEDLNLGSLK